MSTLRTYIELVCETRNLSTNDLKSLSYEELSDYARNNLQVIGVGSSRKAYRLNSRHVLKLAIVRYNADEDAIPHTGIAQNEREFEVSTKPDVAPLVPHIIAHADDFTWLVSELVRPLYNAEEFCSLAGIKNPDDPVFKGDSTYDDGAGLAMATFVGAGDLPRFSTLDLSGHAMTFMKRIDALVKALNIVREEISLPSQWGKTSDGRLVVLDTGIDFKMTLKYYR